MACQWSITGPSRLHLHAPCVSRFKEDMEALEDLRRRFCGIWSITGPSDTASPACTVCVIILLLQGAEPPISRPVHWSQAQMLAMMTEALPILKGNVCSTVLGTPLSQNHYLGTQFGEVVVCLYHSSFPRPHGTLGHACTFSTSCTTTAASR